MKPNRLGNKQQTRPSQTNMPLNTKSQKGNKNFTDRLRSAMNARLFIYATMVMAQVLGSLFGFGSVTVNELFGVNTAHAAEGISHTINYQGKLMDSTGTLVSDGDYDIKFVIYDSATGNNQLWSASTTNGLPTGTSSTVSVAVTSGLFSILLGDTSGNQVAFPDSLFNNDTLYLGITIGADSEMTPRKRLSAVPYAYNSEMLQGQYASGTSLGSDANLFALNQASSTSAYATRTALYVETQGGDNEKDFLVRGNDGTNDVFSISRQGNVTTTGNLQVDGISIIGSATDTAAYFNSYINSDFVPYVDNNYGLGSATYRWKNLYSTNVSSTNIDALGYVSTTNLYLGGSLFLGDLQSVTDLGNITTNVIGTAGVSSTGDILPTASLAYDLGSSSRRWNDVWASSTYIGSSTWNLRQNASGYFTIAEVGGGERVTVDTSGNLGINNTNPAAKLDVVSPNFPVGKFTRLTDVNNDISSGYLLKTQASGDMVDGFGGGIVFDIQDNTSGENHVATLYGIRDGADNSGALTFNTYLNGTRGEGMRINASGFVGIGSNAPSTRLQVGASNSSVNEGIRITGNADAYLELFADEDNVGENDNPYIKMGQDGSDGLATGYFLMGMVGTAGYSPEYNKLYSGTIANASLIGTSDWANSILQFGTADAVRMTILGDGNVGIGRNNPSEALDVVGNIRHTGNMVSYGGNYAHEWMQFDQDTNGNSLILGSGALIVLGAGESMDQARSNLTNTQESLYLTSDGDIQFVTGIQSGWAGRVDAMSILSSGNVGIGDTTPLALFTVGNGDLFQVSSTGNLAKIRGVDYAWSTTQGGANTFLKNDGTGNLTWATVAGASTPSWAEVTLVGATSSEFISFYGASSTGNITPGINDSFDIGSTTSSWRDLYVSSTGYLSKLSMESPAKSDWVTTTVLSMAGRDLDAVGDYLYIAGATALLIYDVSNRDNPVQVGSVGLVNGRDVIVRGEFAYVLDGNGASGGFKIIDISDPASPQITGFINNVCQAEATYGCRDLKIKDNVAYMVANTSGFRSIDISSSTNPTILQSVAASYPSGIDILGDYLYMGMGAGTPRFRIYDISDPSNMTYIGGSSTGFSGNAFTVVVKGDYAYVADSGNDIEVFDVTNPAVPTHVANIAISAGSRDMQIVDNYLYANDNEIFDISDPLNPVLVGRTAVAFGPHYFDVDGGYVYGTNGETTGTSLIITKIAGIDAHAGRIDSFSAMDATINNVLKVGYGGIISQGPQYFVGTSTLSDLSLTGRVNSNLLPYITNTYSLGNSTYKWLGLYASNVTTTNLAADYVTTTELWVDGVQVIGGTPNWQEVTDVGATTTNWVWFNGASSSDDILPNDNLQYDLGSSAYRWKDVWASSTRIGTSTWDIWQSNEGFTISNNNLANRYLTINNSGTLLPGVNNVQDIGNFGSSWKNIYASGTIYSASIEADDPITANISVKSTNSFGGTTVGAMHTAGNYAYIVEANTAGGSYLRIIDTSSSTAPVQVGSIFYPIILSRTALYDVEVRGKYAYITYEVNGNNDGFFITDISNPASPVNMSTTTVVGGGSGGLTVYGKYLYKAVSDSDTLAIYDVSNPTSPQLVVSHPVGDSPSSVRVQNGLAYVINRYGDSLTIIDVSDPANPVTLSTTAISDGPETLEVQGRYAYVAYYNDTQSFGVIDISDPSAPTQVATLPNLRTGTNVARGMRVQGDYVYLAANYYNNFTIIDVSKPTAPVRKATLTYAGVKSVDVHGQYIYLAYSTTDLAILKMPGVSTNALLADSADFGSLSVRNDAEVYRQLTVHGALNVGEGGIYTNGTLGVGESASIGGNATIGGSATIASDLTVSGNTYLNNVFVSGTAAFDELWTKSITQGYLTPEYISGLNFDDGNAPYAFDIQGNYTYIAEYGDFYVIDHSDKNNPKLISNVPTPSYTAIYDVKVNGDYAYFVGADTTRDLFIYNISKPSAPVAASSINLASTAKTVQLMGQYAYVGMDNGDIAIVNIMDPANLTLANTLDLGASSITSIKKYGSLVYVGTLNGDTDKEMIILDAADPKNPSILGGVDIGATTVRDIYPDGRYAYVATLNGNAGTEDLLVYDVSNPTAPVYVDGIDIDSDQPVNNIQAYDQYLYLTSYNSSVYSSRDLIILDISSSTNITYVDSKEIDGSEIPDLAIVGNYAHVLGYQMDIGSNSEDYIILKIGDINLYSAEIGSLNTGTLWVNNSAKIADQLFVGTSINIGNGGLMTGGGAFIGSTSTMASILPIADNSYDLGSAGQAWRNLYVGGTVYGGAISITPNSGAMEVVTTTPALSGASGNLRGMDVVGDLAYISDIDSGVFKIYDVSNKVNPVEIGSLSTGQAALGEVIIRGNYAYVAGNYNFLTIDISSSTAPELVSISASVGGGNPHLHLYAKGNHVYFPGSDNTDVFIFDVSDPIAPTLIKTINTPYASKIITGYGDYVYTIPEQTANDPISVINVADPVNAYLVGTFNTSDSSWPVDMVALGNHLYSIESGEFTVLDISDPVNPFVSDTLSISSPLDRRPQSLVASDKYVYGFSGNYLTVFDVSDPYNVFISAQENLGITLWTLDIQGDYAYVIDSSKKMHIVYLGGISTHSIESSYALFNKIDITGLAQFGNDVSLGGALTVGMDGIYNQGRLDVLEASRFYSTSTFADIAVNGRVNSDLLPYQTLTYNLGSSAYRWKDVWASSTRIGTSTWDIWQSNTGLTFSKNNLASKYLTITNLGTLLSGSHNTQDIGTASNAWSNIYASGTSYLKNIWTKDINASNINNDSFSQVYYKAGSGPLNYGAVEAKGRYLYVAGMVTDGAVVTIYDVSNPESPISLSNFDLVTSYVRDMKVSGDYLYTNYDNNSSSGGLRVIDISDPQNPVQVGATGDIAGTRYGMDISGKYAYLTDDTSNDLHIIDISIPEQPVDVAVVGTNGTLPVDVSVLGRYAYITNYTSNELSVIDIGNPLSAVFIATSSVSSNPVSIETNNGFAYMTHNNTSAEFSITNIMDPYNPVQVATLNLPAGPNGVQYIDNIAVSGNYVYVAGNLGGAVMVIDVSSSTNPVLVATESQTNVGGLAVEGQYVYAYNYYASLGIYYTGGVKTNALYADWAEVNHLSILGNFDVSKNANIQGGLKVGAEGILTDGTLDVAGTSTLRTVLPAITNTYDLGASDKVWRNLYTKQLNTNKINLTPGAGTVLSRMNTDINAGADSVELMGNYMFVGIDDASGNYGVAGQDFQIFNISDPEYPKYMGGINFGTGRVYGIKIVGNYAYLAGVDLDIPSGDTDRSFVVVDISDPYNPIALWGQNFDNGGYNRQATNIEVADNYLYIADYDIDSSGNDIRVYDISVPSLPVFVGGFNPGARVYEMALMNDKYMAIASVNTVYSSEDVLMVDISDPSNITYVDGVEIGTNPVYAVKANGTELYIGTQQGAGISNREFAIIDASSPTNMSIVSSFNLSTIAVKDIALAMDYAYILQDDGYGSNEVSIIDISSSTKPTYVAGNDFGGFANVNQLMISGGLMAVAMDDDASGNDLYLVDINGLKTFAANIGNLSAGLFTVSGDGIIGNNLFVKNDIFAENLELTSNVSIGGTLRVDATSTMAAILPKSNNLYDLGAYGSAWRNLYVSGITTNDISIIPDSSNMTILSNV
ncbi:MAG: hypothetical protein P1P90_06450, partial [Patescibacteria group bacterium]|nr:hypothetical protein [Patescibacteria group bacterium]